MNEYDALEPKAVWRLFADISRVPRESGHETAVMEMLQSWAEARSLRTKRDQAGNLLVKIPATRGHEKAEPLLIQGHADMVCEKEPSSRHDFRNDPIRLQVDGDWIRAEGTTLGADNGIGVAMGLALAEDPSVIHGPVELLLTVDEETGLTGAAGVKPGFFTSRRMINLDSEEDDGIFIGCAGGRDTILTLRNRWARMPKEGVGRRIVVGGLRGGHSGCDIHRNYGNAIKTLTRLLLTVAHQFDLRLTSFDGGSKRNAIPRDAEAVVVIGRDRARKFKNLIDQATSRILEEELAGVDDGLIVRVRPSRVSQCLSLENSHRILRLLAAIPSNVIAMSQAIPGLVESSSNLGVVRTEGTRVRIICCSRSSVAASLEALAMQHRALGEMAGAEVEQPEGYPGWRPNLESPLLAVASEQYEATFGVKPELKAIHGGLECGLLTEIYPDLDIISFGPNIEGAHSPSERLSISSVKKIWKLYTAVLESLA